MGNPPEEVIVKIERSESLLNKISEELHQVKGYITQIEKREYDGKQYERIAWFLIGAIIMFVTLFIVSHYV